MTCGFPVAQATGASGHLLTARAVGQGMVVSVWLEGRAGVAGIGAYCSVSNANGTVCAGIPQNGLLLPRRSGALVQCIVERVSYDRVGVAIVTTVEDESFCVSWSIIQVLAPGESPAFRVTTDSSLVCSSNLKLSSVVPSEERWAWLLFQDLNPAATSIIARRMSIDPAVMPTVNSFAQVETGALGCSVLGACTDGEGGVIWCGVGASAGVSSGGENRLLRIWHFDRFGLPDPRWPAAGLRIAPTIESYEIQIEPDRNGGAYVCWLGTSAASLDTLRVLGARVGGAGSLEAGWRVEGTVLVENDDPRSRGAELCVGENGELFAGVLGLYGCYLVAFDKAGRRLPGWSSAGVPLAPPRLFGVESRALVPLVGGGVLALWDDGLRVRSATATPVPSCPPSIEVIQVPICPSSREQRLAGVCSAAPEACTVFWEETAPVDAPGQGSDLYMEKVKLGGLKVAQAKFSVRSVRRGARGIRVEWSSPDIIDEVPEIWTRSGGASLVRIGSASRIDSWSFGATVPYNGVCGGDDVEVLVMDGEPNQRCLAKPLLIACSEAPRIAIESARVARGGVEVRGSIHGAFGDIQLSLYDVTGRRVSRSSCNVLEEGEFVARLSAPNLVGFYWVQALSAGRSASRGVVLTH